MSGSTVRLSQTSREGDLLLAQRVRLMEREEHRPPIETLACPYEDRHLYSREGAGNLAVRKLYCKECIRYLGCSACSREFSESVRDRPFQHQNRRGEGHLSVAEHLSEGGRGGDLQGSTRQLETGGEGVGDVRLQSKPNLL